jgi:hypothetical protein
LDIKIALLVAMEELKAESTVSRRVALRQSKYLNNLIEQNH